MVLAAHLILFVMAFLISIVVTLMYIGFIHLDNKLINKHKGPDYIGFLSKRIGIFFVCFFIVMLILLEVTFFLLP